MFSIVQERKLRPCTQKKTYTEERIWVTHEASPKVVQIVGLPALPILFSDPPLWRAGLNNSMQRDQLKMDTYQSSPKKAHQDVKCTFSQSLLGNWTSLV
jgi:hypothetical protein